MAKFFKRYRGLLVAGCLFLAAYSLFGFLALPGILQPRLTGMIEQQTGRRVRLAGLTTNPFTLSVTLREFSLEERDTSLFLGFRELYLNYDVTSLVRGEYRFDAIRLDQPFVAIRVLRNGAFNFQDILDSVRAGTVDDTSGGTGRARPLHIADLVITNGSIRVEERSRPSPFTTSLDSISLTLQDFTTRPDETGSYAFEASTNRDEYLRWKGSFGANPPASSGEFELRGFQARTFWEYLRDEVRYEVTDGLVDTRASYEYVTVGDSGRFALKDGLFSARNVRIVDRSDSSGLLALPSVTVSGVGVEFPGRTVRIASIRASAPVLDFTLLRDTTVNWVRAFMEKTPFGDSLAKSTPSVSPAPPWAIHLQRIESSGGKIRFRDETAGAFLDFGPADLTVSDLRYGMKGAGRFRATMPLNGTGKIRAEGTVALDPLVVKAKVTADSVAAGPFSPYLSQFMNATMRSGMFALNGNASLKQLRGSRSYDFKGQCALNGFRFTDNVLEEDFLRWDRLELRDLDYRSEPPAVTIREIFARRPFLRFVIGPDRISNIQHIIRGDTGSPGADAPRPPDTSARRARTRIGRVTIADGLMAFGDLSLTPSFSTGIEELGGVILDLSSDQLARADIDLRGKVDRYAPAVISGQINPLSEQASTDVLFSFHNIELTKFSSYSGKFMGYKIDKGKLSVDLRYTLNQRYLKGENKIVIDQLTLGEAVEGPDVTSLPVRLAIALLKDRNGVIDIDLPVEGSIDDPEFSMGPLIWKALTNLVVKLVTAPFALLGSLFGGGEDLDHIHFAAGTDSLAAAERAKLDNIVKGLQERPALRLDVRGLAVESLDGRALAGRSVNARLGVSSKPTGERRDDLSRVAGLYRKTFGTDPMLLVPVPAEGEAPLSDEVRTRQVVTAAYQRLVDSTDVPQEEIRALAVSRAEKIRGYVVGTGGIDASRVFFLDVDPAAPASEGEVRLPLALNAM